MVWSECLKRLETRVSDSEISTWLRPLHAQEKETQLSLLAPNSIVLQKVHSSYFSLITEQARHISGKEDYQVFLQIGSDNSVYSNSEHDLDPMPPMSASTPPDPVIQKPAIEKFTNNLNSKMTFDNFVEGKSNSLARAASMQVGDNPGGSYNPIFIYGGVGLGKTHLMHSIGNRILDYNPNATVVYLHSEAFVNDMITAIRTNRIDQFKLYYRSVDALLIDDIQFFAGKGRSMEEFFHTFNALLEGQKQIVLTSDRYPRDVEGLDDRLRSRFTSGLSVAIDSPDLETRVAILRKKAEDSGLLLPNKVAFFIAQRFHSNIRELEGALQKVIATIQLYKSDANIDVDFVQEALKDQLASHEKTVTIDNVKKTVAQYFNIRTSDLESKSRTRSVTRPRQIAMALCKELTQHSLPEIGKQFGNRDHSTVLHACRKIVELRTKDNKIEEDIKILTRTLTAT
ncbi:MAG: Chromosomal replication initiator protein DnaA [uncultured Thiotrichaceae bacterium]|uniref:Chromosomal replication initiator protein DnaA n=1 Tax=uncultured Thiotrichaceae bacterium TaxID=298394 RepID=A0A6S6TNR0_9GAMM|nr:MAG: Chromosomal replication initiator protein DnaA [uncultured Thiotrichaceae bacterium]